MSGFVTKPEPVEVPGLTHIHTGKVRDLYTDAEGNLVMVASNRMSAFDWVLDPEIPEKGRILTSMSLWWFDLLADLYPNHVISTEVPAGAPPTGPAARWCAAAWTWCRWNASPAAT